MAKICVEFRTAEVVSLLRWWGSIVLHVTWLLFTPGAAIFGKQTFWTWNPHVDDWRRVFTTSRGQVTIAPTVPATLNKRIHRKDQTPWDNHDDPKAAIINTLVNAFSNARKTFLKWRFQGLLVAFVTPKGLAFLQYAKNHKQMHQQIIPLIDISREENWHICITVGLYLRHEHTDISLYTPTYPKTNVNFLPASDKMNNCISLGHRIHLFLHRLKLYIKDIAQHTPLP